MQDKSSYLLAADSEGEMDDWISTLNKILHSSFEIAMQDKRNGDLHDGVCACVGEEEVFKVHRLSFGISHGIRAEAEIGMVFPCESC